MIRFGRKWKIFIHNDYIFSQHIDIFFLTESNSSHKKSIYVTGNRFLSQEINSSQKNSLSFIKLALSAWGIVWGGDPTLGVWVREGYRKGKKRVLCPPSLKRNPCFLIYVVLFPPAKTLARLPIGWSITFYEELIWEAAPI